MSTTLSRSLRRPTRAALALGLAVLGLSAFAATANANFTLNSGTLNLTAGSGTTDPPSGSWVTLPTDNPLATPNFFDNSFSSTWGGSPSGKYTLISGKNAGTPTDTDADGLLLGTDQPAGGIVGDRTDLFGGYPFYLFTESGAAPELTFTGSATSSGTRTLVAGDLSDLKVSYGGNTYDVSTTEASGGGHTVPLTGTITGDATVPGATIKLSWVSDLTEPGFSPFRAGFGLDATYTP